MSADFTPTLDGYSGVKPFRFWCQKTLPLVYDDSLSYYELLNKVVYYVNNLINDTSTAEDNIGELLNAYNLLQSYVNDYFGNLDVQNEIDTKLDNMADSGELSNLIFPFIDQNNPSIVDSVSQMTDTNHIYVLAPGGHIYTYKNGVWTDSNIVYGITEDNYLTRRNSDINNALAVGSYRINRKSLESLDLDLPSNRTLNNYYWSCFVVKPSTANDIDVTQFLIGQHQSLNETVVYSRTSISGAFNRGFIKIFPTFQGFPTTAINDATKPGSYRIEPSSLANVGIVYPNGKTVDDYYWSCFVFDKSTDVNRDVNQFLIAQAKTATETLIYSRTSVNGNFGRTFVRIFPTYDMVYSPTNIGNCVNAGSYYVDRVSLTELSLELPTNRTLNNYYWSCFVVKPAVANNIDVTQFLIANHTATTETLIFTRCSINGAFNRNFVRIFPFDFNKYLTYMYKANFTTPNIDTNLTQGSYHVNKEDLRALDLDLPLGRTVDNYYWSCFVMAPATANNIDVTQFLVGCHQSQLETVILTRTSINGAFTRSFVRMFPLDTQLSGSITKICFIGDSFTASRPGATSFVNFLNPVNKQFINLAVSGDTPDSWYNNHADEISADYDIYFVAFGLNGATNGNISSTDVTTFAGGMKQLLNKIIEVAPTARIIIWCMDAWYREDRSDLAKQLAEMYGCEFYSMKDSAQIPVRIEGKYEGVMPTLSADVIAAKDSAYKMSESDRHPNTAAQKMLATYLDTIL